MRYRLLETVRHYALAKLDAAGEAEHVRSRHADYFVRLAEVAAPELVGNEARAWLARLKVEHDNLRAAWTWAIDRDPGAALRLAGSRINFWGNSGFLVRGAVVARLLASIKDWGIDARRAVP